jgi:hypothetical protein
MEISDNTQHSMATGTTMNFTNFGHQNLHMMPKLFYRDDLPKYPTN